MARFANELKQAWRSLLQRKTYFLTCAATLTLVLAATGIAAAFLPAMRILRVHPAEVLRS